MTQIKTTDGDKEEMLLQCYVDKISVKTSNNPSLRKALGDLYSIHLVGIATRHPTGLPGHPRYGDDPASAAHRSSLTGNPSHIG
jgi:hypothetical protein